MPLSAKDPIAKWIYDFKKSDAPQFKGKSGEERKAMAIAAYMDAKKGRKQEKGWDSEVNQVESTDAYAKSQAAIRDRKKRAGMTSSDQHKMGAVADMMRREREKRARQRNEENADECWTGYKQQGMKKKGDKMVPNCVPESAAIATPSSQEFIPSPTGGKKTMPTKVEGKKVECPQCEGKGCNHCDNKGYHMKESVETDSAARKPVTFTDPRTGKKSVRMQPAHRKELDHDHKKEVGEKTNNLVAKHARKYNKAHVMTNRKKAQKKGYEKHKGKKYQYEHIAFDESMDPRDHTDKPGHLVVVTKPSGKKMIKHYHPTAQGAKKYADRINRTNRVGHKATVHKTDGRRIMESGSEDVVEFLVVKKNPSFSGSTSSSSSSSSRRGGSASSTSGQSVTTTSGNGYKIKRNIKTGKTTKTRYNVGGRKMNESTYDKNSSAHRIARRTTHGAPGVRPEYHKDGSATVHTGPSGPRSSTDGVNHHLRDIGAEHGHSTKELGKKHVTKHDGHTHTVTTKDGHSHQIHIKAHGTNEAVIAEATSQKLLNKMKELAPKGQLPRNSVELRKLKARAQEELRKATKAKKAAPKKSTTMTSTGKKHMGSMEAGDRNIVMQLRKAQDLKGNHDILVSPKGRTVRLPKTMIDKLLKRFDSLQKPQDKRRFQIMVTKELRKRAK